MRLLLCFLFALAIVAQPREVAITIDDLPRGGDDPAAFHYEAIRAMTEKLLKPLAGTHAIGFVNPGRDSATAIGDDNPAYHDVEAARALGYPDVAGQRGLGFVDHRLGHDAALLLSALSSSRRADLP